MKRKDWLNALLCVAFASSVTNADSKVRITEIMTSNIATIISDTYNYDGYVELYNDGSAVNLSGWTITNNKGNTTNWTIKLDSSHNIPKGYSLLFFGDKETSSSSATKVNSIYAGSVGGKLSTEEGSLTLEKDGEKIELSYPIQYPHISYCTDGYMMPTPGKENDKLATEISNRVAVPTIKAGKPGLYDAALDVELDCKTDGATIYYTTNGDIPTPEKAKKYSGAIKIDASTSLRARAFKDGMLFSEIFTGSYILPDKWHADGVKVGNGIPVVSLTANDADLFDSMIGMYIVGENGAEVSCTGRANYNQDWTRAANFEYFIDGKSVDNQEIEFGIYGGCTRIHVGKSLKIKASKRSGKNKMSYDSFFPSREYKKYKSLALRNGGNGYQFVQPRWRDMYIQSLADGMNVDKQEAQPVAFYLNGEFYGMFILTERTNKDYVYHNYGLDEDEIDMFSMSGAYQLECGTQDALNTMLNYVKKSYHDPDFYDKLNTMMDIDEYMDYQIVEQYVGNTDWVTNNTKIWRKHDGGRFRWILFDTDFGLSPISTALDTNMIDFTARNLKTSSNTAQCIMQAVLKNDDLRWRFLDQYLDRLENQFTDERIDTKWDSIWKMTDYEMHATINHSGFLGGSDDYKTYQTDCEIMNQFAKDRKAYVIKQLKKEYELGDKTYDVKIRAVFPNGDTPDFKCLLNKRECDGTKYNTTRYDNSRVKVEPIVPYGYKLTRWELNNEMVTTKNGSKYLEDSYTTTVNSGEVKISMYFDYDPNQTLPTDLYLNEVCASNASYLDENGEASDWIEIYNGSDKDVDIAGMVIENETKAARCTIPSGDDATIVPAHGYKLLWADKTPDLGTLHLNFKLGATVAEKISLHTTYLGKDVVLSTLKYAPHKADESYGRETDGADSLKLFSKCTNSEGDTISTYTPLAANGSVVCSGHEDVKQVSTDNEIKQVYAQGKSICIRNANGSDVRVYSLLGNVVANKKAVSDMCIITIPTPGIYLVKVDSKCWKVVIE